MSNNSKIVIGMATAAVVGAAIGLMFAPEKGTDLRKMVKKNANSWADELLTAIQNGKDSANQLADDVQGKAKSWKNKAKEEIEDAVEVTDKHIRTA